MTTTAHFFLIIFSLPFAAAQNAPPTRDPPSPPSFGGFNPSMAIIIVVLISAFFLLGFFSIYVSRCGGRGDSGDALGGARNGSARGRSRRGANRGLDQAAIDTFPTFAYSEVKSLKLGKGTLECAVCLCEFEDKETLRLLPKCSHVFHPDCIDMWLSTHVTCPVCRTILSAVTADDPETTGEEPAPDLDAGPESDYDRDQESIAIVVGDENDHRQDLVSAPTVVINPAPNGPPRSASSRRPKIAGRFPRSHSTGHSLVQPGETCERYTLRLPEHVRKQILQRTGSCVACQADASEGSTRRGRIFGGSESGAAKSDRWVLSMVPSFISRSFSVKSVSVKRAGGGDVEQGAKPAFPSVNSCLGGFRGGEEEESASTRPQRSATPVFTGSTPAR